MTDVCTLRRWIHIQLMQTATEDVFSTGHRTAEFRYTLGIGNAMDRPINSRCYSESPASAVKNTTRRTARISTPV